MMSLGKKRGNGEREIKQEEEEQRLQSHIVPQSTTNFLVIVQMIDYSTRKSEKNIRKERMNEWKSQRDTIMYIHRLINRYR